MPDWKRVAAASEIPEGEARVYRVNGKRIAVCRVNDELFAIDDVCTHDGGPLGQGTLDGYEIECPRHGARFDVRTGQVTALPAVIPIKTYGIKVEGEDVFVSLNPA